MRAAPPLLASHRVSAASPASSALLVHPPARERWPQPTPAPTATSASSSTSRHPLERLATKHHRAPDRATASRSTDQTGRRVQSDLGAWRLPGYVGRRP